MELWLGRACGGRRGQRQADLGGYSGGLVSTATRYLYCRCLNEKLAVGNFVSFQLEESAGENEAPISLLSPSLPMIIRCGYEGQLISNRMISIAVCSSDPAPSPSRPARAPAEEKLQTKIEFKFY